MNSVRFSYILFSYFYPTRIHSERNGAIFGVFGGIVPLMNILYKKTHGNQLAQSSPARSPTSSQGPGYWHSERLGAWTPLTPLVPPRVGMDHTSDKCHGPTILTPFDSALKWTLRPAISFENNGKMLLGTRAGKILTPGGKVVCTTLPPPYLSEC